MLNKIFLAVLAVAVLGMSVLIFYAHRQLQSIGFKPETIAENFAAANAVNWKFLWFSAIALLVLGNVILWTRRRSWALWATLGYFVAFVVAETWWLGGLLFDYQRQNNLVSEAFSGSSIFGAVLCILAAIIVFFNQYLVVRLRDRMYPPVAADAPAAAEDAPRTDSI